MEAVKAQLSGVYQIWYNEQTRKQIVDAFTPFHNPKLSEFFENDVILNVVSQGKHKETDWFGVLSPEFFSKAATGGVRVTELQKRLNDSLDMMTFTRSENTNMIKQGDNWHRVQNGSFSSIVQQVIRRAGIEWSVDDRLRLPIYNNYVIARPWVWDRYVNEMLLPCMEVMENAEGEFRELLWQDAKYHKSRRKSVQAHLQANFGVPHYPLHTFICERFWSVWVEMNWGDVRVKKYWEA